MAIQAINENRIAFGAWFCRGMYNEAGVRYGFVYTRRSPTDEEIESGGWCMVNNKPDGEYVPFYDVYDQCNVESKKI
jgi:hypothetical protein